MARRRMAARVFPIRRSVQWLALLLSNPKLTNFASGRIVQSPAKSVCVPFLNCYSCPAAVGACPVGAFQSLAAGMSQMLSLYVAGFLVAAGAAAGRFICGWLCPFGLIQ
ncbi:MAG: 4Fe-4S binding protein, partial [Bacillota bacterium]